MILLDISGADATLRKQDTLTCGMVGAKVRFRFDGAWDGLTKTAVFRCGKVTRDCLLTGDTAVIPHEALTAPGLPLQIGVYGADGSGTLVIPTLWAATCPVRPGADPSGDTGADPTLPIWAQIRAKAETNGQNIENLTGQVDALRRQAETNGQSIGDLTGQVDALRQQAADTVVPPLIVETAVGMTVSAPDSAERPLQGLTLYGKTTQAGTPTPDAPVALENVGGSGEINVAVCGENKEPQTLLVSTPNGLPGIPVSGGGNYTDASGQQWICDEVDFERGVYVKNIGVYSGTVHTSTNVNAGGLGWVDIPEVHIPKGNALCDIVPFSRSGGWAATTPMLCINDDKYARLYGHIDTDYTLRILYTLAEPIETALSAEEMAAYATLHTNYPNTTVYNDAGAGMEMKYVADTKLYIDRKFTQLQDAILSSGANV